MRRAWAVRLARAYARWKLRRALGGVFVAGLDAARARVAEGPVVLAATHVSWWDGFVMVLLDEALGAEGRVLVEAPTLTRLPWLGAIGAIGLGRGQLAARDGLRAAASTLDRPGRVVWIFPQGRQRPPWIRPLGIERGAGLLARWAGVPVIPVALTYAFREDERPAALVHLGEPVAADAIEVGLERGLAGIDRFLEGGDTFEALVAPPRRRTDQGPGARFLAWMTR